MNDSIVFSSWQDLPEFHFQGYCFVGTDFVFGPGGATKFIAEGGQLNCGEDGYYLLLKREGDRIRIGGDFSGSMRIFYFSDGKNWAASNSFIALAEHLKSNGVTLHIERAHLAAFFTRNGNFKQLLSEETVLKEIRFLPADMDVLIEDGNMSFETRPLPLASDYAGALQAYLTLWRNRIATVLSAQNVSISTDVSGGMDTRTVVGFLKVADELPDLEPDIRYVTTSGLNFEKDEEVAHKVAESFGWTLDKLSRKPGRFGKSAEHIFKNWRGTSLGQYATIRFADGIHNPQKLVIAGEAGEILRGSYKDADIDSYLKRQKRFYGTYMLADKERWARSVKTTMEKLKKRTEYYQDPVFGYYRQYRARCHGGARSRNVVTIMPLGGKAAYQCTAALDYPTIRSKQVHYDIMYNLHPELMEIPYDEDSKAPTPENIAKLTKVDLGPVVPGQFFVSQGDVPQEEQGQGPNRAEMYGYFADYLDKMIARIPKHIVPEYYIENALKRFRARGDGDLKMMPNDTIPAHNLALFGELMDLAEWPRARGLAKLRERLGFLALSRKKKK